MVLPPDTLFEEIYRRHGHRCPMSTLGGRMGHAAQRHLGSPAGTPLAAICGMRTCAVDGIRCAIGCSESDGSLIVEERGRHLLVLEDMQSGVGVEVELTSAAFDLSGAYRQFREALERQRPHLDAARIAELENERERRLDKVLRRLRTAGEEEILTCRPLRFRIRAPSAVGEV